jgi:hypothetical protein
MKKPVSKKTARSERPAASGRMPDVVIAIPTKAKAKEAPAKGRTAPAKAKEAPARGRTAPAKAKEAPAKGGY